MLARSVTDGYFHLPPLQCIFSPRRERAQQHNHLLMQHFAPRQALHAFFNAQVLQLRHTTQTHSKGGPLLKELLILTRNMAQEDLF